MHVGGEMLTPSLEVVSNIATDGLRYRNLTNKIKKILYPILIIVRTIMERVL
jgi:hypothetical protein